MTAHFFGGCQCGAVRFRIKQLGNSSICHCRMCQKAFGNFYAPLVRAHDLDWTRGAPKLFRSSNKVVRGFCEQCGTPLTYDYCGELEVAVGALDNPANAAPKIQLNPADKQVFVDGIADLPTRNLEVGSSGAAFLNDIESYQHPDHETDKWVPDREISQNSPTKY